MNDFATLSQRADAMEEKMSRELDYHVVKSRLHSLAEGDLSAPVTNVVIATDLIKGKVTLSIELALKTLLQRAGDNGV